jgi:hypothetical protein
MGGDLGSRRLRAFGSLAGNTALLRVLAAYLLFILTEYAVWIAMLVFAYSRGGTAVAGLVAVAQLVSAALVAPVASAVADRRSPMVLLVGGTWCRPRRWRARPPRSARARRWRPMPPR